MRGLENPGTIRVVQIEDERTISLIVRGVLEKTFAGWGISPSDFKIDSFTTTTEGQAAIKAASTDLIVTDNEIKTNPMEGIVADPLRGTTVIENAIRNIQERSMRRTVCILVSGGSSYQDSEYFAHGEDSGKIPVISAIGQYDADWEKALRQAEAALSTGNPLVVHKPFLPGKLRQVFSLAIAEIIEQRMKAECSAKGRAPNQGAELFPSRR